MTPALKQTLDFITGYYSEHGYAPTLDEIAAARGVHSKGPVSAHVGRLIAEGYLVRTPGRDRAIAPVDPLHRFSTAQLRAELERRQSNGRA